jgi:hypothetical protein
MTREWARMGGGAARTKEARKWMKAFVMLEEEVKNKRTKKGLALCVTVNTQTHCIFPRALALSATINHH